MDVASDDQGERWPPPDRAPPQRAGCWLVLVSLAVILASVVVAGLALGRSKHGPPSEGETDATVASVHTSALPPSSSASIQALGHGSAGDKQAAAPVADPLEADLPFVPPLFGPSVVPAPAGAAPAPAPAPGRLPNAAPLWSTIMGYPGSVLNSTAQEPDVDIQDGDVCRVSNVPELRLAIENLTCSLVLLSSFSDDLGEDSEGLDGELGAFTVPEEIVVSRRVVVQGSSVVLPRIDCAVTDAERCFRVVPGGFLDLRYVRIVPGGGRLYDRFPPGMHLGDDPEAGINKVQVVQGGCVMFEPGADGGVFTGVLFIGDEGTPYEVQDAIELTMSQQALRIYGGHVYMAGGNVQFYNCMFWDFELFIPIVDRIRIGGDVLILAGEATFTGCFWSCTTWFGVDAGVGLDIAIFGGVSIFNFCHIMINNGVAVTAVAGQTTFIGGGVTVFTGCHTSFFSSVEMFDGAGAFTVAGGVLIFTGVSIQDNYGMVAGYGVGLDVCLLAGVLVATGREATQFMGPLFSGLLGGFTYVGAGTHVSIGSSTISYGCLGTEAGGGGAIYNGGGISVFVACPTMAFNGVWASLLFGGLICLPAGVLVWVASPIVINSAVEYFAGIGGAVFVGAGTALMGYSPSFVKSAVINHARDFWISGACEPEEMAWAPGPLRWYDGKHDGHCVQPHERDDDEAAPEPGAGEGAQVETAAAAGGTMLSSRPRIFKSALVAQHMPIYSSLPRLPRAGSNATVVVPAPSRALAGEDMARYMSGPMYTALQTLADRIADIESLLQDVLPSREDLKDKAAAAAEASPFYINSPMEGDCSLCEVDNLQGPGFASCERADFCGETATGGGSYVPFGAKDSLDFDFASAPYTEHFLVMAHLAVTTTKSGDGAAAPLPFNTTDIDAALLSVLGKSTGGDAVGESTGPDAMYVTVYSADPEPFFAPMSPGLAQAAASPFAHRQRERALGEGDGAATTTSRFKAVMVATTQAKAQWLVGTLGGHPEEEEWASFAAEDAEASGESTGADADAPSPYDKGPGFDLNAALLQSLLSELGEQQQQQQQQQQQGAVVGVDAWYDRTIYVPAYNSKRFLQFNPAKRTGAAYSVLATDPSQPAVPLREIQRKHDYDVHIQDFPAKARVAVYALRTAADDESDEAEGAWLQRLVSVVSADEEGAAEIRTRFWSLAFPPGDYHLKAVDLDSGAYGLSPVYRVSDKTPRRLRYGPLVRA